MTIKLLLPLLTAYLVLSDVQSAMTECFARNNITDPAEILHTSTCCLAWEWLVREEGEFRCEEVPCLNGGVLYEGQCHDVFEEMVCGEEDLGERLYLGDDGLGYCDCDEGWVRYQEKCYQEFTPAFCRGENEILKLRTKPKPSELLLFGQSTNILVEGLKKNFACIENPCQPSYFPHT